MSSRRELLSALAGAAGGIGLAGGLVHAQGQAPESGKPHEHGGSMKTCYDACSECARVCNHAFHHCLAQAGQGKAVHARMAQMVADSRRLLRVIGRNDLPWQHAHGDLVRRMRGSLSSLCPGCATSSDAEMKSCAESCERCEESCRNMIKTMKADSTAPASRQ